MPTHSIGMPRMKMISIMMKKAPHFPRPDPTMYSMMTLPPPKSRNTAV